MYYYSRPHHSQFILFLTNSSPHSIFSFPFIIFTFLTSPSLSMDNFFSLFIYRYILLFLINSFDFIFTLSSIFSPFILHPLPECTFSFCFLLALTLFYFLLIIFFIKFFTFIAEVYYNFLFLIHFTIVLTYFLPFLFRNFSTN